jgi:hypothetical protein
MPTPRVYLEAELELGARVPQLRSDLEPEEPPHLTRFRHLLIAREARWRPGLQGGDPPLGKEGLEGLPDSRAPKATAEAERRPGLASPPLTAPACALLHSPSRARLHAPWRPAARARGAARVRGQEWDFAKGAGVAIARMGLGEPISPRNRRTVPLAPPHEPWRGRAACHASHPPRSVHRRAGAVGRVVPPLAGVRTHWVTIHWLGALRASRRRRGRLARGAGRGTRGSIARWRMGFLRGGA